jgi:hypothetical protein
MILFGFASNFWVLQQQGSYTAALFRNSDTMPPMSEEDLEWFKSTFRPIPKPELPDDCIEYSLHYIPSDPAPAVVDEVADTRSRLIEVQKSAAELVKSLLKDYIWQREGFKLEITKANGAPLSVCDWLFVGGILMACVSRHNIIKRTYQLRRLN